MNELVVKFKHLAKNNDAFKELLGYIKNNKKKFKTLDFYADFEKKKQQEEDKQKKDQKKDKLKSNFSGYLDEDDVLEIRSELESRNSMVSRNGRGEEYKHSYNNQLDRENVREIQLQKGKVKSTYIMKDNNDSVNSSLNTINRNDITQDANTLWNLDSDAELIFRIIRHQLKNDSHPIRLIIEKFTIMFVRAYKGFVNKSHADVNELYAKLEQTNTWAFQRAENGSKLKQLHTQKRKSEKSGNVSEADRLNLPTYFLFNQVVGDVQTFIEQMVRAVILFYSIVAKENDLSNMKEEIYECITDWVLKGKLQKIVFSFFKLESESKRKLLVQKFKDYMNIWPEHVGIDEKFTLNESSPIIQIFEYMAQERTRINASVFQNSSEDKSHCSDEEEDKEGSTIVYMESNYRITVAESDQDKPSYNENGGDLSATNKLPLNFPKQYEDKYQYLEKVIEKC